MPITKVATDTMILDLRTRYRTKVGWFLWFCPIQRYDTTKAKMANFVSPNQMQIQIGLVLLVRPDTRDDTSQPCCIVISSPGQVDLGKLGELRHPTKPPSLTHISSQSPPRSAWSRIPTSPLMFTTRERTADADMVTGKRNDAQWNTKPLILNLALSSLPTTKQKLQKTHVPHDFAQFALVQLSF